MALELKRWIYFLALAQELNFAVAAERVGTDPVTFARKIRELEHIVKVKLVDRRNRRVVRLMLAGKALVLKAQELLDKYEESIAAARSAAGGFTLTLKIGVFDDVPDARLAAVLAALHQANPKLDIRLVEKPCDTLMSDLRAGTLDLALCLGDFEKDRTLEAQELWTDRPQILLPATHKLAAKAIIPLMDFAGQRLVLSHRQCSCGRSESVDTYIRSIRAKPILKEASSLAALRTFVASGYGAGIISSANKLSLGRDLVKRTLQDTQLTYRTSVVYRKDALSGLAERFVNLATGSLKAA